MGCNYFSVPEIPASGTKVLIWLFENVFHEKNHCLCIQILHFHCFWLYKVNMGLGNGSQVNAFINDDDVQWCNALSSGDIVFMWKLGSCCPACRTTLIATRFRVAVICPIIQVPHCIRVFFYFVWFVFINHIFQFYNKLCTYCNILDICLS